MDWKAKLQAARDSGQKTLGHQAEMIIEENWPKVQLLFEEKVGPAALAAAQNDEAMRSLFKLVYVALPFPVHLAVTESTFISFCFTHRNRLLPQSGTPAAAAPVGPRT